jgi:TonB-dependent starch-binding outer membrane protein SusC
MKKCNPKRELRSHSLYKILSTMRNAMILLVIGIGQIYAADSYSQTTRLNLDFRAAEVAEVLGSIEAQSEFYFLYNDKLLDVHRLVNVQAKNELITAILDRLFNGTDITYTIIDRKIILAPEYLNQQAQERSVSGSVNDERGAAMPGVSVQVRGTQNGVMTDANGRYTLSYSTDDAILLFSFIGYETAEIAIGGRSVIDVKMVPSVTNLDEVVVIGYGTAKREDLTGSISSIRSKDLPNFPRTSIGQALQGLAAGVHVQQNSGQPGAGMQIRIRGTNSIQGSNEPLWIIDGFPGQETFVNPADIESIEILKDASATAIYGSRGANGVVIVTTKQGREGPTRVEVSSSYSVQRVAKKLEMMNGREYAELFNIYSIAEAGSEYFSQDELNSFGNGVDWQDLIFRPAPVQDHSFNISGGNARTRFALGGSALDQKGIIQNSDYRRLVLRGNISHDISDKIAISFNTILNRIDQQTINEQSVIAWTLSAPPTVGPYLDNGDYRLLNTVYPFSPDDLGNPIAYFNEVTNKRYSNNIMANMALTVKPIEGLSIRISGNVSNIDARGDNYTSVKMPQQNSSASINASNIVHFNFDNVVTYNKNLNDDHSIAVTGGLTYETDIATSVGASGSGFLSDVTETHNLGGAATINVPSSSRSEWTLLSYLGRVNYSFKGKYLATATIRADGSSRYSENNKWGIFPSGAVAWNFAEENFMNNLRFISEGKFRVGYGETGSTAIPPYYTLNMLSSGKVGLGNALYTFFAPGTRLPGDLKWESTAQLDVGADLGFFNNRVRLTADYYIKRTRDLLNSVQLPLSLGYVTTLQNVGEIENKGVEIQLGATVFDQKFKWDVSGNIAFNRNKVVSLYGGQDIQGTIYSVNADNNFLNLLREGEPFGAFYGYELEGLDDAGHFLYKDLDGNGVRLTPGDRTWIGDPNPNYIFGFTSHMSWHNFSLNIFLQGSVGNDIFGLSQIRQNYLYYTGFNTLREVRYDHWSPSNLDAKYPAVDYNTSAKYSDQFVFDGSYVRLKNIEIGYNVPVANLDVNWLKGAFVYMSGQNLLTLTDYDWWDPEVNSKGGANSVNQGIDHFSYPSAKGATFGVKLSF